MLLAYLELSSAGFHSYPRDGDLMELVLLNHQVMQCGLSNANIFTNPTSNYQSQLLTSHCQNGKCRCSMHAQNPIVNMSLTDCRVRHRSRGQGAVKEKKNHLKD